MKLIVVVVVLLDLLIIIVVDNKKHRHIVAVFVDEFVMKRHLIPLHFVILEILNFVVVQLLVVCHF